MGIEKSARKQIELSAYENYSYNKEFDWEVKGELKTVSVSGVNGELTVIFSF